MAAANEQKTVMDAGEEVTRQIGFDANAPVKRPSEPPPRSKLTRGSIVGRYVILEKVGTGGFGDVYSAYDPDLDRKVALKLMKTRSNRLGTARVQLLREAQALAKLSHENVVTVFDFGEFDDDVFISMEFVDGVTLKEWFVAEPRTWQEVRDILVSAGRGLAAAHSTGIVHSDFKPQNVLVDPRGRVAVADLGLAKALQVQPSSQDSNGGEQFAANVVRRRATTIPSVRSLNKKDGKPKEPVAGSPAYMAPEQFGGGPIDERSDQFSFCVTLFEGLFGQRPFPQANFTELRMAIEEGRITQPEECREVPKWVKDIVYRGLSRDPYDRFDSMDELIAAMVSDPHQRGRQRAVVVGTAIGSAAVALALSIGLRNEPTVKELGIIDGLVVDARASAAQNYFVHPPVEEPKHATAYTKILELEELNGGFDPQADERAKELREEFGSTLVRVGDYYWEAEYGKIFALDYYAQALVFDPENNRALERAGSTEGSRIALREKAAKLDFTAFELVAAEPLAALATAPVNERARQLKKLVEKKQLRSSTSNEALNLVAEITDAMAQEGKKEPTSEEIGTFVRPLPKIDSALVKEVIKTSATSNKENSASVVRSGESGSNRSKHGKSIVSDRETIAAGRRSSTQLVKEGRTLLKQGDLSTAAQVLHRALLADRRNAAALMGLSDVYFEQGNYHQAVEYGKRGVALKPRHASYRISLGDAYQKIFHYQEANEHYQAAAKRGSKTAKKRIRQLRSKLGK